VHHPIYSLFQKVSLHTEKNKEKTFSHAFWASLAHSRKKKGSLREMSPIAKLKTFNFT